MTNADDVAGATYELIDRRIDTKGLQVLVGTWRSAESFDADLSVVEIEGATIHYVRKLAHVTGLTNGDTIELLKQPGFPLTIQGKIVGNIVNFH